MTRLTGTGKDSRCPAITVVSLARWGLRLAVSALIATVAGAQQPADPRALVSIEGTALGAGHLPLPGTSVSLTWLSGAEQVAQSQTYDTIADSFGRFSFQGLKPGRFTLLATHADYALYDLLLARIRAFSPNTPISQPPLLILTAGQHVTDLVIELLPMTVLSGKVTDEDGNPMPGVTVRPMRAIVVSNGHLRIANSGAGVQTGAGGEYELTVDTGRWYLSFLPAKAASAKPAATITSDTSKVRSDSPGRDYVITYFPGVRDLSLASGIVAAGPPLPELNVRLQKIIVYHVRGRISGDIPPEPRIVISQPTGNARPSIVDDGQPVRDDGTFDLAGLSPGEWILNLRQYGKVVSLGLRTVRIGDSDVEDVVIPVQPLANLRGSFRVIPEQPLASVPLANPPHPPDVQLVQLDPMLRPADAEVQSDGTFTVEDVEAGRYLVHLEPPPGGFVKSVIFDGRECIESGIDFTGATRSGLQITVSMTAGQISGTVTNPDGGLPARSGAVVTLMPDGPPEAIYRTDLHRIVRSDPTGNFAVKSVTPGTYRVYAWERLNPVVDGAVSDAIPFSDPEFPRLFDNMSAVVTVGENESKQVSLTLISAVKMDDESSRHR